MIVARRKFSLQYRDEAVKMVVETARPIAEVARELGLVEGTLGRAMLETCGSASRSG